MLQGALNRKDSQKLIGGFSHFYQKNLILGLLTIGYFFIVSTLSIPARLILRKNIGERSIAIQSFFLSMIGYIFLSMAFLILFSSLAGFGFYEKLATGFINTPFTFTWSGFFFNLLLFLSSPFTILLIVILAKAISHFKFHISNHREKVVGYSFYRGQGIYFRERLGGAIFGFEINENILRMIVEPLGLIKANLLLFVLTVIAMIFRAMNPVENIFFQFIDCILFGTLMVSITLILSSIALFLEEISIMQKGRDAILDMIDGEFDMQKIISVKETLRIQAPNSTDVNILN